jgi:pSer/pThr/pTyr-binding forkhead associated (FHA) protein
VFWHYQFVTSPDPYRLAKVAYEAHRSASADSTAIPPWSEASKQEQDAWRIAVTAATAPGDVTFAEGGAVQALVVQAGDQTHVFHREFTAGRQGELIINDDHASSHHALFQSAHSHWWVEDLGSTNGTWLNGRRMFASQRLKKGDKIKIGRTTITILAA